MWFGFNTTPVSFFYFTDDFVHSKEYAKTFKSTSVLKSTGSVHPLQLRRTQRQHRTGCFIFHVSSQLQQWKIQAVQISMELHISTCTFRLLSKELGQTFVSSMNTTWAVRLPPCDVLHMKTLQCSFGNGSF